MNNNDNNDNRDKSGHQQNQNGQPRSDDNRSQGSDSPTARGNHGSAQHVNPNPGNFANDPERAREAGRKGGQS
jgi:general stress protein YciG